MKRNKGFTLIELMITICILGIIFSFIAPTMHQSIQRGKATSCVLYRQNIQTAADIYIKTNNLMPGLEYSFRDGRSDKTPAARDQYSPLRHTYSIHALPFMMKANIRPAWKSRL